MKIGITTRIIYEDGIRKQFVNEQYIDYVRTANLTPVILPMIDSRYPEPP
jgi:gamma-glutamyl-gamma-aminobutyrate hydrolase PuuD